MPPVNALDTPAMPDIPVLDDVVTPGDGKPVAPKNGTAPAAPARSEVRPELLSEMLTERIAALTDRLLRDASNDIQDLLMDKIWEKLRVEIPAIVAEALGKNGHNR
ncbi:MAG: hypothetical protein KGJ04_06835 [Gammaproteobacteria bacterium]|nr:hypothetical protein [Gammaproteobacteria bacterium]